ncbi:MAG: tRNA-(ms[2]io[6]A)-hydroxylase [Gammaproteobacteria bacterium]|nr:tRNA-(ms[2]io[6]A)-hydroxylase [Gammaproteobacteria bacterium]
MSEVPTGVGAFLKSATPPAWLEAAIGRLPELLLDHANCEKKAASSALSIVFRYPQYTKLVARMSRLAREELRHFEQVSKLLSQRGVAYAVVPPSAYAGSLRSASRGSEPGRLVETLIIGALIEARSCERFALLVPRLPDDIAGFYRSLLDSEKRHFEVYLDLARDHGKDIEERVEELATLEADLVTKPDQIFAFHSGIPIGRATIADCSSRQTM